MAPIFTACHDRTLIICKCCSKHLTNIYLFKIDKLWRSHYYLHFMDENTGVQKDLSNFPKATELISGGVSAPRNLSQSPCC